MAPGAKLPYDAPLASDIKSIIRRMLTEELKITAKEVDGHIHFQPMLKDEPLGEPIKIRLKWYRDSGHGGEYFVDGLTMVK